MFKLKYELWTHPGAGFHSLRSLASLAVRMSVNGADTFEMRQNVQLNVPSIDASEHEA